MRNFTNIYLAGGMSGLPYAEYTEWRERFKDCANMMNEYGDRKTYINMISPPDYYNFKETKQKTEKEVKEYDLHKLSGCDVMIVYFNDPLSVGTAQEMMFARMCKIPIIGVRCGKEIHPWLEYDCMRMCDSIEECMDYLDAYFLQ